MTRSASLGRALATPRVPLLVLATALAAAAAFTAVVPASPPPSEPGLTSLAERLGPRTWALAIPASWIAAPIPGLREGDVLDLLGTRASERATASEVASGLRVMSVGGEAIVVELTADDASAIASARAQGRTLVPILRSAR